MKNKKGGYRNEDEILTDEQLTDLFQEMKRETMAEREKTMQKFKFDAAPGQDDDVLEELGGLEDDDEEEDLEQQETREDTVFFNDQVKRELEAYRQMKQQNVMQQQTVERNLDAIFSNFQVFKQQRHKVQLEEIESFETAAESADEMELAKQGLVSQLLSELNPFAQFVIEEIVSRRQGEATQDEEEKLNSQWNLHEDIFKSNNQTVVNPEHLQKSSSQMFAVYKYYGDPTLKVKSTKYTKTADEYVEVKSLVEQQRFFDAPDKHLKVAPAEFAQGI